MYFKQQNKLNICLVTYPLANVSGSYYNLIVNFVKILTPLVNKLILITANFPENQLEYPNLKVINLNYKKQKFLFLKVIAYLIMQVQISYNLAKVAKQINGNVFILSGEGLFLPIFVAKILGKKIVLTALAPGARMISYTSTYFYAKLVKILELISVELADKIILESPNVARFVKIDKYQSKIWGEGSLFILDDFLEIKNKISQRRDVVGYIGRLSKEKGVLNLVKAIPKVLRKKYKVKFLLVGDGQLRDEIKIYLGKNNLTKSMSLIDWVPHVEISKYLNELKLFVLPSYTEGLPNIMLEAMASGTPILATPVGGIPDIIKDCETGFIMENNSPECIAENIIRALNHPHLEQIVQNARALVEKEFTFEAAVKRWRKILAEVL